MPYDYIEEYQKQDDETIWEFRDKDAQSKIDISLTETEYANPLFLETMQAQVAKNTKIKIEPIQDLHGYDKPWIGGAWKNKLPLVLADIKARNTSGTWSGNNYTRNGVTFSIITDESENIMGIKAIGTATANTAIDLSVADVADNTPVILNGCPSGGSEVSYYIGISSLGHICIGSDVNYNNYNNFVIYCFVSSGYAIPSGGVIFTPMVRLSTESDATFAPYTNECSISGRTEIDILGCGKNILPMTVDGIKSANSNRTWTGNSTVINDVTFTILTDGDGNVTGINTNGTATANAQLYIKKAIGLTSGDYIINGAISSSKRIFFYDGTTWYDDYGSGKSFIISSQTVQEVAIVVANGTTVSNEVFYPMIRLSTESDSNFAPYQESNNLSIDLPSTVYGGVLDLENGELVVDRGIYDLGDLTFTKTGVFWMSEVLNVKSYDPNDTAPWYCDSYPIHAQTPSSDGCISSINWKQVIAYADISEKYSTGSEVTAAMNGVHVCCELATPLTLHISPEHLKLLKAQNNLTTSQNTQIKVTYRNGVFATLEELSDTANGIYDEISGDATTVSGNPINFTTREKQKSKSTIIDLEPIQDLHGYNKPWVGGAGKNLIPMQLADLKTLNTSGTWSGNVYTWNDISFTILTDLDNNVIGINVNGTTSGRAYFTLGVITNKSGTSIILNGCPVGGVVGYDNDGYNIFTGGQNQTNYYDTGDGVTGRIDINEMRVYINIKNTSISNKVFYPMLRLASVSDATFEPYTNITSISGRSEVGILGLGRNQCNVLCGDFSHGGITFTNNGNGTFELHGTSSTAVDFRINQPTRTGKDYLKTYFVNNVYTCQTYTDKFKVRIMQDQTWTSVFDTGYSANPVTQIISETKDNCFILVTIPTGKTFNHETFKIMLELGSDASSWEKSQDLTISLGQTVYGGQLDVEKGEVTITHGYERLLKSLDWNLRNESMRRRFDLLYSFDTAINRSGTYISNYLEGVNLGTNSHAFGVFYISNSWLVIPDSDSYFATLEDFKDWLDNNEVYICYELATPTTIQLTPQQVQLLKGINNISTTGTTITVTFKNGSVAHLDDLPENVFTDLDKEKLASIDTLAITLDLLTHTLVVTQDI